MMMRMVSAGLLAMLAATAQAAQTCDARLPLAAPDSRYQQAGATVLDKTTGLVWLRCPLGMSWVGNNCTGTRTQYTWQQALQQADTSTAAGYSDWRLPNVRELASLLESACFNPAINLRVFPNTPNDPFWSSSPYVGHASYAWVVFFNSGIVGYSFRYYNGGSLAVRLVRGG